VSDIISFLAAGLDEIGLAAAASPRFAAEGLIAALRRAPPAGGSGPGGLNRRAAAGDSAANESARAQLTVIRWAVDLPEVKQGHASTQRLKARILP